MGSKPVNVLRNKTMTSNIDTNPFPVVPEPAYFLEQRFRVPLSERDKTILARGDVLILPPHPFSYYVFHKPKGVYHQLTRVFHFTSDLYTQDWVDTLTKEGFAVPFDSNVVGVFLPEVPTTEVYVRNLRELMRVLNAPPDQLPARTLEMVAMTLSAPEKREETMLRFQGGVLVNPTRHPDYDPFEGIEPSQSNGDPTVFGSPRYK